MQKLMEINAHLISGVMVGIEIVPGDGEWQNCFVIDLFIVRIMFHWGDGNVDS